MLFFYQTIRFTHNDNKYFGCQTFTPIYNYLQVNKNTVVQICIQIVIIKLCTDISRIG